MHQLFFISVATLKLFIMIHEWLFHLNRLHPSKDFANQSFLFLLQIFERMQAIQVEQPFMNHDKKF